jgi:hypothetical protein
MLVPCVAAIDKSPLRRATTNATTAPTTTVPIPPSSRRRDMFAFHGGGVGVGYDVYAFTLAYN